MSNTIYCTYLTVYSGNKLPPFYIGSTSVENINKGYHGSVKSKKYKEIWKSELKNNLNLFKTKILTTHNTREEALEKEQFFHQKLDVVKSPLYVNRAIASKNGCFGVSLYGKENHNYGKKPTQETRNKISQSLIGRILPIKTREKLSISLSGTRNPMYGKGGFENPMYGKTHTEEARKNISLKVSGENNGSYGRKWYYNPETHENIKCSPEDKPENYVLGRKMKQKE